MPLFIHLLLTALAGAICEALIFGVSVVFYMYARIRLRGNFVLMDLGFLGTVKARRPWLEGMAIGGAAGLVPGFAAGLLFGLADLRSVWAAAALTPLITASAIFGLYFSILFYAETRLGLRQKIRYFSDLRVLKQSNFYPVLHAVIVLVIPSSAAGVILAKIIPEIARFQSSF